MPGDAGPVVRRIEPTDGAALRDLRLEALADTPFAFLETLESARALTEQDWEARARRGSEQGTSIQAMAFVGPRPVGTALCYVEDGSAWFGAVYVSPAWRGRGLLAALLDRCTDWARSQGQPALLLEVHEDNTYARRAYERLGFVDTGRRKPYPLDPSGDELVMALQLGPRPAGSR